jgi:hypothetical protein
MQYYSRCRHATIRLCHAGFHRLHEIRLGRIHLGDGSYCEEQTLTNPSTSHHENLIR